MFIVRLTPSDALARMPKLLPYRTALELDNVL